MDKDHIDPKTQLLVIEIDQIIDRMKDLRAKLQEELAREHKKEK